MKLTGLFKKTLSVLCLGTVFCGCASTGDVSSGSFYSKKTTNDSSVYFAQSPSMESHQKELAECLFRVARQISIRKQVSVKYIVTTEKLTNGTVMKRTNVLMDFDQSNSIAILDRLTVLKVDQKNTGTEALIRYEGKSGFKTPSISLKSSLTASGNPAWVTIPPKGSKFYAAVGSITQRSSQDEAFTNSDTNAIGALAELIAKPSVTGNTSVYSVVMQGVYIASRWYNPSEKRFYSLAILPR